MFTHKEVWQGIDRLAKQHGLTPSGLARRAGLDPTTFNPSKRVTKQNKPRWPSTESLAKILNATATPFDAFVALMPDRPLEAVPVPSHIVRYFLPMRRMRIPAQGVTMNAISNDQNMAALEPIGIGRM